MLTVAVTGGIGSGKSTVSTALAELGAIVVDSDVLAREVVAPRTPGLAAIAEAFGAALIGADGALDRAGLAGIVFADPAARARLEAIIHPLVRARAAQIQREAPVESVVVHDIPILTTLAVAATFQLVVGVRAGEDVRVARLVGRGLAEPDARSRIASQITDDERAALCDVLLDNDGDQALLVTSVGDLWRSRIRPFADNVRAGRRVPRSGPRLVDPDPRWPVDARRLAARVSRAAGGARVDHIGSTAIVGMPAKDVIDLQLTVPDLQTADDRAPALRAAGFPVAAGFDRDNPHPAGADQRDWCKRLHQNADPGRSINLHVRVRDSAGWRWALLFRDWLAADPSVAADYLALKRSFADAYAGDPTAARYAEAKEPWMAAVYERGVAWATATGWRPAEG
ncbi:MAG TPA: dephospho-CoA kinase [Mycobacterium sp.]